MAEVLDNKPSGGGRRNRLYGTAFGLALVLPWLNPVASGPAPSVEALVFAIACATGAFWWLAGLAGPELRQQWAMATDFIFAAWLAASLLSCAVGLLQYFGLAALFSPWINSAGVGEAVANLRQRNQFASLTSIGLAAALQMAGRPQKCLAGWLMPAMAVLLAIGNAASSSRTGLMQLVLLCALVAAWGGIRNAPVRRTMLAAVSGYIAATFLLPLLAGLDVSAYGAFARLRTGDALCSSRLTLWSNVLHLIAQKPWFGWGWGELDYAHYITLYNGPRFCDILDNAHNLPLHLAVELGIPLALLACGLFVWWIARQRPWRETDPTRQMAWAVLAVILLHSMLEYPLWYGPFQMATGLCLWMLWRRSPAAVRSDSTQAFETTADRAVFPWRRVRLAIGVAILTACAYAAWDYWRISQVYLSPSARDPAYRENTLEKIRGSWLFSNQVSFAELGMTGLTPSNAQWTYDTATRMLHFSPEPRVIEKVIESATMLGLNDVAVAHVARYRAAFPVDYAKWQANNLPASTRRPRPAS